MLVEDVDRERHGEADRRRDPDPLAAVGLGHHRVREHREDRSGREREHECDDVRRRMLEPLS
jgi:hypothetical protein